MKLILKRVCSLVIDNYRKVKEELRFDGDYINHFAAVIYSKQNSAIDVNKIKKIRSTIKNKTSRVSCFRGDILYIVSILIGKEDNADTFIDELISTYNMFLEVGFKESEYLVISAYSVVKHCKKEERLGVILRMKNIFKDIKNKYYNLTNEEDYVECALLAINNIDKEKSSKYMENKFNSITELNMFSHNGVQGLVIALLLNNSISEVYSVRDLLIKLQQKNVHVSNQCLPLLGIVAGGVGQDQFASTIKEVAKYLGDQEPEYEFYMDRSFRTFLIMAINELAKESDNERYLDEFISLGVYSFILSKNQGMLSEILA